MLFGALEAGGTKMVVAIGDEKGNILEQKEIPTTTPEETMPQILDFFKRDNVKAIGIGAFGPVCVDETSKDYGRIGKTPKLPWVNFSWKEAFEETGIPVAVDTDVNVAALGEVIYGSAKGLSDIIYITIGTGIGVGVYLGGKLQHGMMHPEAGHILLEKRADDHFEGNCPYHKNCFEGLASGPAIQARYGKPAALLTEIEEVWELEADYIAKAIMQYICCYSPKKVILGGGVMHVEKLFSMIREKTLKYMNGYITAKELDNIDEYIVPAGLKGEQGIKGALYLAEILNA